jgi:hypothetical protein
MLPRCFFKGLPIIASSGGIELNTLLAELTFGVSEKGVELGGVVPNTGVPIEPGDFRDGPFRGSAECCRLSCPVWLVYMRCEGVW